MLLTAAAAVALERSGTVFKVSRKRDAKDLDVRVKVGWVRGMNRLYFLYEAYDNYWDFRRVNWSAT